MAKKLEILSVEGKSRRISAWPFQNSEYENTWKNLNAWGFQLAAHITFRKELSSFNYTLDSFFKIQDSIVRAKLLLWSVHCVCSWFLNVACEHTESFMELFKKGINIFMNLSCAEFTITTDMCIFFCDRPL